jgi:hypothetical protein
MENIYQNPVVFKIHNGTTRGDINLCTSCRFCHRTVASQSGRETMVCNANRPFAIKEPIATCNIYLDRSKPTLHDMQEIAWTLMTDKGGRKIGFQSPEQRRDGAPGSPIGF